VTKKYVFWVVGKTLINTSGEDLKSIEKRKEKKERKKEG
jgi:hypothetical protein